MGKSPLFSKPPTPLFKTHRTPRSTEGHVAGKTLAPAASVVVLTPAKNVAEAQFRPGNVVHLVPIGQNDYHVLSGKLTWLGAKWPKLKIYVHIRNKYMEFFQPAILGVLSVFLFSKSWQIYQCSGHFGLPIPQSWTSNNPDHQQVRLPYARCDPTYGLWVFFLTASTGVLAQVHVDPWWIHHVSRFFILSIEALKP